MTSKGPWVISDSDKRNRRLPNRVTTTMRTCQFIGGAILIAFLLPLFVAHAQRSYTFPSAPPIRGSLVADGRVWTVGTPRMVAENVTSVLPSPDFKHLLIAGRSRVLTPSTTVAKEDQNAPGEISLTWWNVRTRRSRQVWRRPIAPGENVGLWASRWLGKTGSAVIRITDGSGVHVWYINPARAQAKEIIIPPKTYDFPNPSPTQPYAALTGPDGACEGEMQFLDRNGEIGQPIPLPSNIFFTRWSEDGTELRGVGSTTGGTDSGGSSGTRSTRHGAR